jgi:Transposase domain (DUF772)
MLIVGYVFAISSERQLCSEVQVNLAYRWFCKLGIEDTIPDHSVFSRARHERFRESDALLIGTVVPLAIMDIRARSISLLLGPEGQGPPDHERAGETIFSICSFLLADLGGKADYDIVSMARWSGCCLDDARFIVALLCQRGPGNTRQFVSKRRDQNVRMQALSGPNEPGCKAVLRPVRRPH